MSDPFDSVRRSKYARRTGKQMRSIKGVMLHHTGSDPKATTAAVEKYCADAPKLGICYHVIITRALELVTLVTDPMQRCAHAGIGGGPAAVSRLGKSMPRKAKRSIAGGANSVMVAIAFESNGQLSAEMVELAQWTTAVILRDSSNPETRVMSHAEWTPRKADPLSSQCPMPEFRRAVEELCSDHADGLRSLPSWTELVDTAHARVPEPVPTPVQHRPLEPGVMLRRGSVSSAVRQVQKRIGVAADSIFGRRTQQAVKRFQIKAGLRPDGIVGPRTWGVLFGDSESTDTFR